MSSSNRPWREVALQMLATVMIPFSFVYCAFPGGIAVTHAAEACDISSTSSRLSPIQSERMHSRCSNS